MDRTRIKLAVYVDLDPVLGTFHTAESTRDVVSSMLDQSIPHYNPVVSIESYSYDGRNIPLGVVTRQSFGPDNPNWNRLPEYNAIFLKAQEGYFNNHLKTRGHVFLNEVFDALGMDRTREGAVCGWLAHSDSSHIQLNVVETKEDGTLVLEIPVDGVVYNEI